MKENNCMICCVPLVNPCFQYDTGVERDNLVNYDKLRDNLFRVLPGDDDSCKVLQLLMCGKCVTCVGSAVEWRERVNGVREQVETTQRQIWELKREVIRLLRELEEVINGFKGEMWRWDRRSGRGELSGRKLREWEGGEASVKEYREKVEGVFQELNSFQSHLKLRSIVKLELGSDQEEVGSKHNFLTNEDDEYDDPDFVPEPMVEFDESTDLDPGSPGEEKGTSGSEEAEWSEQDVKIKRLKPGKRKKGSIPHVNRKINILESFQLGDASPFRQSVVTKMYRSYQTSTGNSTTTTNVLEGGPIKYSDVDPMKSHTFSYNPESGALALNGIQLTIDEREKCVICSECGLKIHAPIDSKRRTVETEVYDHVFGYHQKLYECPLCHHQCSLRDTFRKHFPGNLIPTCLSTFTCDICGKPLKSNPALNQHKWSHLNETEKQEAIQNGAKPPSDKRASRKAKYGQILQCKFCRKRGFPGPSYLRHHENRHNVQEPQFMCPDCGKQLKTRDTFNSHRRFVCYSKDDPDARQKALPFQCQHCLKRWSSKENMERHVVRVHSNLRAFLCDLCPRAFKSDYERKGHQKRMHQRITMVQCEVGCGASFVSQQNAKRHAKKCRQDKPEGMCVEQWRPYKCNQCPLRFKTVGDRNAHQEEHTSVPHFCVGGCGLKFKSRRTARNHEKKCPGVPKN